jgi:asparagine N-glycosylation enzyme membrane subunit Stt3
MLGVFGLLQIVAFAQVVRSHLSSKQFQTVLFGAVVSIGLLGTAGIIGLTLKGWIAPWTGRFYSLWDTGYAKKSASLYQSHALPLTSYSHKIYPYHRVCLGASTNSMAIVLHGLALPHLPLPGWRGLLLQRASR